MGHWQVQKSWANMSICTRCTRWIRKYREPQLTDLCDALCGPKQCAIQKLRSLRPPENDVIRNYCRNTYLASATDTYTRMHVGCSSSIQWMYLRRADCLCVFSRYFRVCSSYLWAAIKLFYEYVQVLPAVTFPFPFTSFALPIPHSISSAWKYRKKTTKISCAIRVELGNLTVVGYFK